MSIFEGPSETTTSIGRRCRGGDAYSRAILIARTLSQSRPPPRKGTADGRTRHKAGEPPRAAGHASASARSRPPGFLSRERVRPLAHAPRPRASARRLPSCTLPVRSRAPSAAGDPTTPRRRATADTKNLRRQQPGGSTSSHSEQRS